MIAGIDPGFSGAMFFMDPHTSNGEAIDLPVLVLMRGGKAKRELDIAQLIGVLALRLIAHAVVEHVGAMPGQGVSGVFCVRQSIWNHPWRYCRPRYPTDPGSTGPVEAPDGRDEVERRLPSQGIPAAPRGRISMAVTQA